MYFGDINSEVLALPRWFHEFGYFRHLVHRSNINLCTISVHWKYGHLHRIIVWCSIAMTVLISQGFLYTVPATLQESQGVPSHKIISSCHQEVVK